MNRKRIIILIGALIASALIVWHDFPIEFPGTIFKVFLLFLKLFVVFALTIFAYLFAGGKKQSS
jgi:hypothetical protein